MNLRKKMIQKNSRRSNLFFPVAFNTPFFGLRGGQEGYGMKMDNFQLHVHLLPCSLINNSKGALHAPFASALKLKIWPCQSRKEKIESWRMNTHTIRRAMQCSEPLERTKWSHSFTRSWRVFQRKRNSRRIREP